MTVLAPKVLTVPAIHAAVAKRPAPGSVQAVIIVSRPTVTALPVAQTASVKCAAVGAVQVEQVTSTAGLPSAEVYCVATQAVFAAQTVAGFASWSHVPPTQVIGGAVSPAQYVPKTQLAQTRGAVPVPGLV